MTDQTQTVTILGPNLAGRDQALGQFHVHAAGCADIKRIVSRSRGHNEWTIDAASKTAIADEINSDFIAEGSMESGNLDDIHFAPCVKLPVAPAASTSNAPKIVKERTNRLGSRVLLVDNRDGKFETTEGLDDDEQRRGFRWATVCETHGNYCLHATRRTANYFLAASDEWCEPCRGEEQ